MKIIFMRHGQAENFRPPDSSRQLTQFGQEQAKETANYIMDNYNPDLFVVSPYDRARQTLQAFSKINPDTPIEIIKEITPDSDATQALAEIARVIDNKHAQANCVLVVCHMPIVANMVGLLLKQWATAYALAEARVIECEFIAENLGTQIDKYIPQQ